MRYYSINITNPTTNKGAVPTFTSLAPSGLSDPGALNIEMDVTVVGYDTPSGDNGSFVRVWGIPLPFISQSKQLAGDNIQVYAGMSKGLPLANPAQSGLLFSGTIWQAFGNWIGTSQTLDLVIIAPVGTQDQPKNFSFFWKAGTSLSTALNTTLQQALPSMKIQMNISPKLVLNHDDVGYYPTLASFAKHIRDISAPILGGNYLGVSIVLRGNVIQVFDGTSKGVVKDIAFYDLVGQPTWRSLNVIQVACVMRADLMVGDFIKLPESPTISSPQSFSDYRQSSIFQGTFQIQSLRHVGNFRQRDGRAWATVIDAYGPVSS